MLNDKVAVITWAGGGIAQAVARKFVSEGARVCLLDSNESSLSAMRFGSISGFP
jgi:NADP-dependent 3-hydroxy acid dehydrogenase YdfG